MTRIFIAKPPKEILENALAVLGYTDAYDQAVAERNAVRDQNPINHVSEVIPVGDDPC